MKIKGAIFDLDGTLLDSMFIWDTMGERYLLNRGITPEEGINQKFLKMSIIQAAQYYKDNYGLHESVSEIVSDINKMTMHFYSNVVKTKPGVKQLLLTLQKNNVKMCIATATDREMVEVALKNTQIFDFFCGIITCSEVKSDKNSPLIFRKALEIIGTDKNDTLLFEDALHAIETAKNDQFSVAAIYDKSSLQVQAQIKKIADYYITSYDEFSKNFE